MANPNVTPTASDNPTPAERKPRRVVPVLVNRASQIQIPTAREKDGSIRPDSILFLVPGNNLPDERLWLAAKKNEHVQRLLQTPIPPASAPEDSPEKVGEMILVESPAVDADNPLVALSEPEALRFVSETFSVPLLKRLEGQEARAKVLGSIRAQVDKIERPKKEARAKQSGQ